LTPRALLSCGAVQAAMFRLMRGAWVLPPPWNHEQQQVRRREARRHRTYPRPVLAQGWTCDLIRPTFQDIRGRCLPVHAGTHLAAEPATAQTRALRINKHNQALPLPPARITLFRPEPPPCRPGAGSTRSGTCRRQPVRTSPRYARWKAPVTAFHRQPRTPSCWCPPRCKCLALPSQWHDGTYVTAAFSQAPFPHARLMHTFPLSACLSEEPRSPVWSWLQCLYDETATPQLCINPFLCRLTNMGKRLFIARSSRTVVLKSYSFPILRHASKACRADMCRMPHFTLHLLLIHTQFFKDYSPVTATRTDDIRHSVHTACPVSTSKRPCCRPTRTDTASQRQPKSSWLPPRKRTDLWVAKNRLQAD
jgi:hypothetical protein